MKSFEIELEGVTGPYQVTIAPSQDNSGKMLFPVSSTVLPDGSRGGWSAVIEPGCDGWAQSAGSLERGPVLPCFFVEELGEKIEDRLKAL